MNRTQKKCVFASSFVHGLLLLALFAAPALFSDPYVAPELPDIEFIPDHIVDAALAASPGGATRVEPAPPAPAPPPDPPEETRPAPQPAPEPKPERKPEPKSDSRPQPQPERKKPEPKQPERKPTQRKRPPVKVNLDNAVIQRSTSARAEEHAADLRRLQNRLAQGLSSETTISMPGAGAAAYADYSQVVKRVYQNAWNPPSDAPSDSISGKAEIVIRRDGTVISARLIRSSGHGALDASIERALKIKFVARFPDGAKDAQRTFLIEFNLKSKRLLG